MGSEHRLPSSLKHSVSIIYSGFKHRQGEGLSRSSRGDRQPSSLAVDDTVPSLVLLPSHSPGLRPGSSLPAHCLSQTAW